MNDLSIKRCIFFIRICVKSKV